VLPAATNRFRCGDRPARGVHLKGQKYPKALLRYPGLRFAPTSLCFSPDAALGNSPPAAAQTPLAGFRAGLRCSAWQKSHCRHPGDGVRCRLFRDLGPGEKRRTIRSKGLVVRAAQPRVPDPPDWPSIAAHPTSGRAGPESHGFGYFSRKKSIPSQGRGSPVQSDLSPPAIQRLSQRYRQKEGSADLPLAPGECHRHLYGCLQTPWICLSRSGQFQRRPVIHGSPDDGQAKGDIDGLAETHVLEHR